MDTEPLVTIVLPAYNADHFIDQAIQSILEQTFNNWELLVINDGSTDETSSVIGRFNDSRICLIEQNNKGVSSARNTGLSLAKGKYVTFLDADDTFPRNSLAVRVQYLQQNPNIHIVGGRVRIMDSTLDKLQHVKKPNYQGLFLSKLLILDEQIFSSICYLVRRDIISSAKFDGSMTHCEDLLFWIKNSAQKKIIYGSVNEYIYNYRVHESSATSSEYAWRSGFINLIKKISEIEEISYSMTIIIRIKVFVMLFKWHLKRRTLNDIHQLFEILV